MPRESHLEFKIGAFVLIAFIALTIFIFSITGSNVLEKGKSLKVIFGFANGLKKSAPVRIAGVDQGLVKNIDLFFDRQDDKTKVEVELWVKKDVRIPLDSVVTVNQLGLMGEKYIEIIPGVDTQHFYEEGQAIVGEDPIAQEEIAQRVMEVAGKLEHSIEGVNKIVNDEENRGSVSQTLKNLSSLTGGLNDIVYDMKDGRGTMGKLLYDARLYEDLEGLMADLKENPWKLLYRPKDSRKK